MTRTIAEIDHLLTYVAEPDAAAALFSRMGFTLSPVSRIDAMGITNYLVLMQPGNPGSANFIELMGSHDRDRLPPPMVRTLSGEQGIKSIVLHAPSAAAAHGVLTELGFAPVPPMHVRREWVIGPGQSVFPEFDVILPVDAPLVFNACQYHNVDLYLRPDWLTHANGARRMSCVFAAADRPEAVVAPLARLFGCDVREQDGALVVSPGTVDLAVMTPDAAATRFGISAAAGTRYLGYAVDVASLDTLAACLRRGDVEYRPTGEGALVSPETGLGNVILFRERA